MLGRAFNRQGWGLRPDSVTEIDNLPLHAIDGDMLPCAEAWLTTGGGETLAGRGIMALLSVRGTPAVQLQHFQSLAEPRQPLAGRWGHDELLPTAALKFVHAQPPRLAGR